MSSVNMSVGAVSFTLMESKIPILVADASDWYYGEKIHLDDGLLTVGVEIGGGLRGIVSLQFYGGIS